MTSRPAIDVAELVAQARLDLAAILLHPAPATFAQGLADTRLAVLGKLILSHIGDKVAFHVSEGSPAGAVFADLKRRAGG